MPDSDGLIAGRYRLVNRLAVGGMSTVWQGWDERLQRPVAVKQLLQQPGLSPEDARIAAQRAMREARNTARLHHPNAVAVLDVVEDDGRPSLVMNYEPSRSLHAVVHDDGPLPPDQVARIGTQIAAALAAAHRVGVVHRDVKPGNVLILDDGVAKLTDFGISHTQGDLTLTSAGLMTGTPAYLAPEVVRGADSSPASDVFALGATLYTALEGVLPFGTDEDPMTLLHRVAAGLVTPPKHTGPLAELLRRMLAVDPGLRPSAVDVANELATMPPGAASSPDDERTTVLPTMALGGAPAGFSALDGPRTVVLPVGTDPFAAPLGGFADSGASADLSDERRTTWIAVSAALVVVAVAAALALVLLRGGGGGPAPAAAGDLSSATRTAGPPSPTGGSAAPTHAAHSTAASTPAKPARHPSPARHRKPDPHKARHKTPTRHRHRPTTAANLVRAVHHYYRFVPGNLGAGWALLTPSFQSSTAGGRASYDRFWSGIRHVGVSRAVGFPPHRAVATLTYFFKDGHITRDRTLFVFVRSDGVLKINGGKVLSSHPVR